MTEAKQNKEKAQLYNIGNNTPVKLLDFIDEVEKALGVVAQKEMLPMQDGDVNRTWADASQLMKNFDYEPNTPVESGVRKFVEWYKMFYEVK